MCSLIPKNAKIKFCNNKLQNKLIILVSTLQYVNNTYKKYTQKNILYYLNENFKRNGQNPIKLKTMQNYLYKLEKKLKITTNYHRHLGVNRGTEIYYKLNYTKKECYLKINQYFKEKKHSRFQNRVARYLKNTFTKNGSVSLEECNNNNNNIKKEEKDNTQIEKLQLKKYFKKCNFLSKKTFLILKLDIKKDKLIEVLKIIKKIEISITKNINLNKTYPKKKLSKLKGKLNDLKKKLEKKGYNTTQLKTNIQNIYESYKTKPHFIIENHKYKDLDNIKKKLERTTKSEKENLQKNCNKIKINIFNILIEQLKKDKKIKILKPIVKNYLKTKNKLDYNKVFDTYYCELLEIIKEKRDFKKKKTI